MGDGRREGKGLTPIAGLSHGMACVVKVYLKVCSEDDQTDGPPEDILESSSVSIDMFGAYVEDLHKSSNKGFKEQFSVSMLGRPPLLEHTLRLDNSHSLFLSFLHPFFSLVETSKW